MNFLRCLALQEKQLDDSSRLDVVEIARVPDMLPSFFFSGRTRDLSVPMYKGTLRFRYSKGINTDQTSRENKNDYNLNIYPTNFSLMARHPRVCLVLLFF